VELAAAGLGQAREQHLADQLVSEEHPVLSGTGRHGHDQPGAFGLVECVEERVRIEHAQRVEELVGEGSPDHRGGRQGAPPVLPQTFQAPAQDDPQALGDAELVDDHLGQEPPVGVQQPPLLGQVFEDLLDEEGVPVGFGVNGAHERRRRVLAAQRQQHPGHALLGQATEADPAGLVPADQVVERPGQWTSGGDLGVPAGAQGHHRCLRDPLGEVLEEQQGRLVGPVEVVDHEEQGARRGARERTSRTLLNR
jgi:hypothetical protein